MPGWVFKGFIFNFYKLSIILFFLFLGDTSSDEVCGHVIN